ncbi:hypothetical protein H8E88_03995 [candidate division KSB1 bacterium]|nr:hypothetical protein [candidate division KSB1 bacterium]MBL7092832.1 hypothetical protein [candidate division KSB1 bacterium]
MKKLIFIAVLIMFIPLVLSAKQPKLKSATIEPKVAATGDTVTIMVEFTGKVKDIKEVSFIIREYPYDYPRTYFVSLKDKKKNIWVLEGPVPWDAYAQSYHLDIRALDKKGKEIVTKGLEKQSTGRTATIEFKVKY